MKHILERLCQQYGEDHFIEVLSDFLIEKQKETAKGTSCWTLLHVPIEFDPDLVIEVAYSCRKNNVIQQLAQETQLTKSLSLRANTDAVI